MKNFLGALFDCDASVRKDNPTFEYSTMSKELAENVILALLRFGIIARKNIKLKCATNTVLKNKKEYYFITIEGKERISKLYKEIPFKCIHKKELLKKIHESKVIPNTNNDLLPLEVNLEIRNLVNNLGIKYKTLRKDYPLLAAYIENRCNVSRQGIIRLLPIFEKKLCSLIVKYKNITLNQSNLITCMHELNISGQSASIQIGVNKTIIMRDWSTNRYNAKPENLEKLYNLIKNSLIYRIKNSEQLIILLKNLANSDVFWDKIKKIDKVDGEKFVYDLEIEDNHNFIANNLFIHNSNITDALCFVLGRLSIKSIRAAKASHLIFSGNKDYKGANEAYVEITFDNSEKEFALDSQEIVIRRIVRKNGQSVYKISHETKTRQECLELLNQAGIDPHGFNIILQGEIEKFVKLPAEERRRILEEVAGIYIYEMRKEKSLKELEKTEERLKQINAILRERTNYLRNLEEEREQALKFKKLEETKKRCKASIINKHIQEREKELSEILKNSSVKQKEIEKKEIHIIKLKQEIAVLNERINNITQSIQKSSGLEQDTLIIEISNLKQEIAGMMAKKENFENQLLELERRKQNLESSIIQYENEIESMSQEKSKDIRKELQEKKSKLDSLEEAKRHYYLLKSNLSALNNQIEDKKRQVQRIKNESNFILNQIQDIEREIKINNSAEEHREIIIRLKQEIETNKENALKLEDSLLEKQKISAIQNQIIHEAEKIKSQVSKLDVCPLCKTKITEHHIKEVISKSNLDINNSKNIIEIYEKEISETKNIIKETIDIIEKIQWK